MAKPVCDVRLKVVMAWARSRVDGIRGSCSIFYSACWFLEHELCENPSLHTLWICKCTNLVCYTSIKS